ncbi:hypothetical protein K2173_011012 [Erythroxylum novogranatense]|uniref:Pentatricopeptide repeat-containing protein n=1 Tax=Erythroxylum novogranatense TaxID=1862640 RepID=A0AAV8T179_9ROSI|nr:hypothetical protein K2173_011012 [Erythroxylum novogranatense]
MAYAQSLILKKNHLSSPNCLLRLVCRFSSMREPSTGFGLDDDEEYRAGKTQMPPEPIAGRRLRGERLHKFDTSQSESHPSRTPPSGPRRTSTSASYDIQSPKSKSFSGDEGTNQSPRSRSLSGDGGTNQSARTRSSRLSDAAFLDQFKLGFQEKKDDQDPESTTNDSAADFASGEEEKLTSKSSQPPAPEDAKEIFKKMKETGLIPSAVAMLDGLCKDGLVQEAMKLFGLIREKGTIPDVVVYTAVVDGFCKAQKFDDAKRVFRKMQNNGITPNAFSYTVLIQGLYKCNHLDDAKEFCIEMLEAGHCPNVATFVGLVDRLCKEKGVEEAQDLVAELRKKGLCLEDKAVRDFLNINAPGRSQVREAIFGNKTSQRPF